METNKIEEALKLVEGLGTSTVDLGKVVAKEVAEMVTSYSKLTGVLEELEVQLKKTEDATNDTGKKKRKKDEEEDGESLSIGQKYKKLGTEGQLGDASTGAQALGDMLGGVDVFAKNALGSESGDYVEALGESLGGVSTALGGVKEFMGGNILGGAMKVLKGLTNTVGAFFKIKDKGKEREIKQLEISSKNLKAEFTKLGKEAEQLFGGSKSDKLEEQIQNLSQQQKNLQEQRAAEESKKKKDDSKVAAYNEQIEKSNAELVDLKAKQIDAIMGQDVKTAIGNFAKAYADAWAAGLSPGDSKKKAKKMVQEMVKTAVTELMKDNLSKSVEAFRSRMSEAIKDGIITKAEQSALDELESRIYRDAEKFDENGSLKKYYDDHAGETDAERAATSKGIAAASQDSVNELNGRFTAIQQHTYEIVGYLRGAADSAEMVRRCVEELGNHGRVLSVMGSEVRYLNWNINNIYSRGIPIRES